MKRIDSTCVVVNLLYLAVVALVVALSLGFEGQGGLVPVVLGVPTLALILFSLGRELLYPSAAADEAAPDVAPWSKAAPVIAWLGAFCVLVLFIGFQLAIPLYMVLFLRRYGGASWPRCALAAFSVWALVFVTLDLLLKRSLFEGVLFGAILPLL